MTDDQQKISEQDNAKDTSEDPIVTYILDAVSDGSEVSPNAIAQKIASDRAKPKDPQDIWRKYMIAVRQQAVFLARNGRLEIVRKGEVADPNDFKGLYKLRLPRS